MRRYERGRERGGGRGEGRGGGRGRRWNVGGEGDGNGDRDASGDGNEGSSGDGNGDGSRNGDGIGDRNRIENGVGRRERGKIRFPQHQKRSRVVDQALVFRAWYSLCRQKVAPTGSQQLLAQDPAPARRCRVEGRTGHQG